MTKIDHKSRAHAVLSASSSARWLACPPSAVASLAYAQQDTAFTREGTLAHEVAEQIARYGLAEKQPDVTGEMLSCAYEYREFIREHIKSPDDLVLYEQRVDFSPWVEGGFGTADCIIIHVHDDAMTVIDYKYGQGVPVSAVDNSQMKFYALGAYNDYGFAYDIKFVDVCIFQPRLKNISIDCLTITDLRVWGEKVKPIAALAAKGEGDYTPGEHCRFCPHAGRCRELTNMCKEYVNTHGMKVSVPVLAPFEVAEVLRMEPLVSLWLKRVKEQALTSMLNGEEIPGYKVVEGRSTRAWANEMDAYKALIANGCSNDEITETKLLSPAAMEKAFGKKRAAELLDIAGVTRNPGSPTIAPESDKRPSYNPANDFNKLD